MKVLNLTHALIIAHAIAIVAPSVSNAETHFTGSGCIIESNRVLTAYHVIDGASIIIVSTENNDGVKARVVSGDKNVDWAVLETEGVFTNHVFSSTNDLEISDKVYTLGFPSAHILGRGLKYTDGTISSLTGLGDDNNRFQMTIPIQPGNSGGPVFNQFGALVGIVSSTIDPNKFYQITGGALPQNVNFAVPIAKIPIVLAKGSGNNLHQNKMSTCFIKCTAAEKSPGNTTQPNLPRRPPSYESDKIVNPKSRSNVGLKDVSSLFHLELGRPMPELMKYKTSESTNAFICKFTYPRPFLNFTEGVAELSKKSKTLISIHAYTSEDCLHTNVSANVNDVIQLIEEKFEIKLVEKTMSAYQIFQNYNPLAHEKSVFRSPSAAIAIREWNYVSWPNGCASNADFWKDNHHTMSVLQYIDNRLEIMLTGTSESMIAEKESPETKEQKSKERQDALDAL